MPLNVLSLSYSASSGKDNFKTEVLSLIDRDGGGGGGDDDDDD